MTDQTVTVPGAGASHPVGSRPPAGAPAARRLGRASWVALGLLAGAVVLISLRMGTERAWNYPRELAGLETVQVVEGDGARAALVRALGDSAALADAQVVRMARLTWVGPGESAAAWVVATRRPAGADRLVAFWSARFLQSGRAPRPFAYQGRPAAYAVDDDGEHFLAAVENLAFWVTVRTGQPPPRAMQIAQAVLGWPYRVGGN